MKTAIILYLIGGAVWWTVTQAVYVDGGYPYWEGFGASSDPNQVFGGILCAVETIALWPYAAVKTSQLNTARGN
jgi:hypothetical protein